MKYLIGSELRMTEWWVENNLAPALQEAIHGIQHKRNGKFAARVGLIKKGLKIIDWLSRAQSVEAQMRGIDNGNIKTK